MLSRTTDLFFISSTFISNVRLKLAKTQANAKQHSKLKFCCLEIIHIIHPKIIGHILKNKQKNNCVCIPEIIRLIVMKMNMKMKMEMKKRSHKYDINRPKIMFIIFCGFLMVQQILLSPQVK